MATVKSWVGRHLAGHLGAAEKQNTKTRFQVHTEGKLWLVLDQTTLPFLILLWKTLYIAAEGFTHNLATQI
jgi:hypothetical protein